jgi:hypothetical protein
MLSFKYLRSVDLNGRLLRNEVDLAAESGGAHGDLDLVFQYGMARTALE